ncbi:hypothetical protein AKO1_009346 [Acrasis kona]|uniref:Uncharacterized protein n=1 Tax=Acrasis kona TaxID=1008807 RepID=A0AAW2ZKN4_9EUKA
MGKPSNTQVKEVREVKPAVVVVDEPKPSLFRTLMGLSIFVAFLSVTILSAYLLHSAFHGLPINFSGKTLQQSVLTNGPVNVPIFVPAPVVDVTNKVVDLINVQLKKQVTYQLPNVQGADFGVLPLRLTDVPVLSLVVSLLFAFLFSSFAKNLAIIGNRGGKYDNNYPRSQTERTRGLVSRLTGAHNNAVEQFAPFAVAVALNLLVLKFPSAATKSTSEHWSILIKECVLVVLARILHFVFYFINISTLRSVVWVTGLISILNLYLQLLGKV